MNKFIALRSGTEDFGATIWLSDYSSQLKQQSLLFDKIGILWLEILIRNYKRIASQSVGKKLENLIAELEWLQENEIIFDQRLPKKMFFEVELGEHLVAKHNEVDKAIANFFDRAMNSKQTEDKVNLLRAMIERDSIDLRMISSQLEVADKLTAVTTLPFTEYARKIPNTRKTNIFQVVINQFPLPDNTVPWEQIIDYRNDPENQNNLLGLRRWIRKISTEKLSRAETQDEIEWRINEFRSHMKLHKMKANTETLEVIVKAPLEIIENLIKLKFSRIPEPLFALKKRQINLMEAELNAPGREISYIIKTQEAFQPHE